MRLLNRVGVRFDDSVIAVSDSVSASLPASVRRRKTVVVHGMDLTRAAHLRADRETVRREVRRELNVSADEVLVLAVANLRPEKGYDVLLEAARLVVAAAAPVRFAAVGRGPQREEVTARRDSLGLGDRFLLLGQRSDVLRLLAGSDIFVLASHFEGLPVALMEATSVGLPIVTTAVGEIPNLLTDGVDALIVAPGQPRALAAALERLVADDQLRRRLGAGALARSELFDITRAVSRIESVYTELLAGVCVSALAGRRVVHVTTSDMSLALLLGPQLQAFAAAGMEVVGASAPGPYVGELAAAGIAHEPLRHATRAGSTWDRTSWPWASWSASSGVSVPTSSTPTTRSRGSTVAWRRAWPGCRSWSTPCTGSTPPRMTDGCAGPFVYGLERVVSVCSQAELVQNVEDVDILRRLRVPERKLVLLGNGVDLRRFAPPSGADEVARARAALGVGPEQVVVGIVGRLVWQKGMRELFAAAARLRHRRPEVVIVVVGPSDPEKADALGPADIAAAEAVGNVTSSVVGTMSNSCTTASTSSSSLRTGRAFPGPPWRPPPAP